MRFEVSDELDSQSKVLAEFYGFTRGGGVNRSALVESVFQAEHLVVPSRCSVNLEQLVNRMARVLEFQRQQQSFELLLTSGRSLAARYAQPAVHLNRPYFDVWSVEAQDKRALGSYLPLLHYEPLLHNRSILVEQIASISSVSDPWRKAGLDSITVSFELQQIDFEVYSPEPDDVLRLSQAQTGDQQAYVIDRRVTSLRWLFADLAQYEHPQILSPQEVADQYHPAEN